MTNILKGELNIAKNACTSSKTGPLIFTSCFLPFAARSKKNDMVHRVHFRIFGSEHRHPGTLGDQGSPCGLGRCVVCVCGVVSVETAMECQLRVNDVFFDVSLSGATTGLSSTAARPAWSQSSCCPWQRLPSVQWRTVLVRSSTISHAKHL